MRATIGMAISLLKLRIGVAIAASALAGIAVADGPGLAWWQPLGLALAILGASGAAGAFNHYYERDLDRLMERTCRRPFASGAFVASPWWPPAFLALLAISLGLATLCGGHVAASYVFLGAFTYGIVYTVWLKRRSTWNIVVGGLAGSFAVLAGAAAAPSPRAAVALNRLLRQTSVLPVADGLAGNLEPGAVTVGIALGHGVEVLTVSEADIRSAMAFAATKMGFVLEGAGAVGVAALRAGVVGPDPEHRPTVVLLTGRNVAPGLLSEVLRA